MIVDLSKRWMEDQQMACTGMDPETFFIDHGQESYTNPSRKVQRAWDHAKEVCRTCPVQRLCARDNLGEIDGVWGGLDPAERMRLRITHGANIRKLAGPLKKEYAALANKLREERKMPWYEVARVIGVGEATARYLVDCHEDFVLQAKEAAEKAARRRKPREKATVTQLRSRPEFPDKAPEQGDAWLRYGRRIAYGYYLGETEDGQWVQLRARLLNTEYSVCWIKREDVKFVREVAKTVLVRSGTSGSRIYGVKKTKRRGRAAQAG